MYYIWDTRVNGWQNAQGNTSSDIKDAALFEDEETAKRVKRAFNKHVHPQFSLIPVAAEIIEVLYDQR